MHAWSLITPSTQLGSEMYPLGTRTIGVVDGRAYGSAVQLHGRLPDIGGLQADAESVLTSIPRI
jgi:hypothetical protein